MAVLSLLIFKPWEFYPRQDFPGSKAGELPSFTRTPMTQLSELLLWQPQVLYMRSRGRVRPTRVLCLSHSQLWCQQKLNSLSWVKTATKRDVVLHFMNILNMCLNFFFFLQKRGKSVYALLNFHNYFTILVLSPISPSMNPGALQTSVSFLRVRLLGKICNTQEIWKFSSITSF